MSQLRLVALTVFACLWCLGLLAFRLAWTGQTSFFFLSWNLFLAAIPLGVSLALLKVKSRFFGAGIIGGWLLFFPNAPYILTDLIHLRPRNTGALWYDLLMLLSFALVGLWMGFQSLQRVQDWVAEKSSTACSWMFVAGCLLLSGFGIYLGRFLRWNSWDIVTRPEALFADIFARVLEPTAHLKTWGVTLGFGGLLMVAYLMWTLASAARVLTPAPVRNADQS